MPFIGKCVIYGQMCHLLANVSFIGKCVIYWQMCHIGANVPFLGKSAICGQMCHLWANGDVPFIGKCAIFWQMGMCHFWGNVAFMGKCAIYIHRCPLLIIGTMVMSTVNFIRSNKILLIKKEFITVHKVLLTNISIIISQKWEHNGSQDFTH